MIRTSTRRLASIATAGLLFLAAACGGSPASTGSRGPSPDSPRAKAVAFAQCMRSQNVPDYPDPSSSGQIPKETPQELHVSASVLQAASRACEHLLKSGGSRDLTQAEIQQWWNGMRSFARCMRAHGVANWPDPTPYPPRPSNPTFQMPASIQPTQQIVAKMRTCQRLVPNNEVAGHIDNNSWQSVSQEMAGS